MVKNSSSSTALFKDNIVFWFCCCVFFLLVGIALLFLPQGSLLLYFNDNRHLLVDLFFTYVTKIGEEPTYILLTLGCLFIRFRYAVLIPTIGLVVTIISFLSKSFFQHPRPSIYYRDLGVLENINAIAGVHLLGGLTSFPSGHTMSAFALFSFLAFLFPKKGGFGLFFFLMALLVGLSRIYLVQHFLKDAYLGAILGVAIGAGLYLWQATISLDKPHWWNRKLGLFKMFICLGCLFVYKCSMLNS